MRVSIPEIWTEWFFPVINQFVNVLKSHLVRALLLLLGSKMSGFFFLFFSSRNLQLPQYCFHQLVDQPSLRRQTGLKQKRNYHTHLKRICLCLLWKLHRPWDHTGRLRPHCLGASCKEIRARTVQRKLWREHWVPISGVWLYGSDSFLRQLWFRSFCPVTRLSADHHRRWKRHRCNSAAEIAGVLLSDTVPVHCHAVGV